MREKGKEAKRNVVTFWSRTVKCPLVRKLYIKWNSEMCFCFLSQTIRQGLE